MHRSARRAATVAFACLTSATAAALPLGAQLVTARDTAVSDDRNFSFYDRGPYRPGVPRPETILGYPVGAQNTQYALQQQALMAIADAAKDRVHVEQIAVTNERRPMRLFVVSSPENIARLDALRGDLDRLADPRGASQGTLDGVTQRTPVVVWIAESIHGNESPGFESGMQLLYQLAASEEPATVAMLKNTVVVLNPSANPDGHERFTVWYNSVGVGASDPGSNEHREPWSIQGRYNHYRFDMNRDVIATTQQEVQGMIRGMLRWHPMVSVDQHGQVGTYFFPPAARPVNANLGTGAAKWLDAFGAGNAKAFDRYGWLYYTRDQFDLYYPGYWDTWPSLTGATGMTYETDGGGWKGLLWRREDGSLLTFRAGIAKHFVSALATIQTASDNREARVRDWARFRQAASSGTVVSGAATAMRRVVIEPGTNPAAAAELASALVRAGVEVRRATGAFSAGRAHSYYDDGVAQHRFDAGAYVVDLAQPQGQVARAVLEPSSQLDTVFAKTQVDRFQRNIRRGKRVDSEGYEFYDITAWSLPVAFGADAYWTEDAGAVGGDVLRLPDDSTSWGRGAERLAVQVSGGIVGGAAGDRSSVYLFSSERNGAPVLAAHLMNEGFRVSVGTQPLDAGGRTWPRGTYVVTASRNDSTLASRLDALARQDGVEVRPALSAFATGGGQFSVGGDQVQALRAPRVAILGDEGISQTGYGALWWSFERRWSLPFTPISYGYVTGGDLSQFNVIVVPSGSPGAIGGRLGKGGTDRLREWMRSGGTLITMGGSSAWAAGADANLTSSRALGSDDAPKPSGGSSDSSAAARKPAAGKDSAGSAQRKREQQDKVQDDVLAVTSPSAQADAPQPIPGANFDVVLDRTHWLTFGYERPRQTVLFDGDVFLTLSKEGSNVAVFPASGKLGRSGFTFPGNTERLLRNTAFLVEEPVGGGHLVLFANEPNFRGWWRALDRMVLNAVVLGPGF